MHPTLVDAHGRSRMLANACERLRRGPTRPVKFSLSLTDYDYGQIAIAFMKTKA